MIRIYFLIVFFVYTCSCLYALPPINKNQSDSKSSASVSLQNSTVINKNAYVGNNAVNDSKINSGIEAKKSEITNQSLMENSNIHINNLALEASKINSGIKAELVEIKDSEISNNNINVTNIAIDNSKVNSGIIQVEF